VISAILPPASGFCSKTCTSKPALASLMAAANPPIPAPAIHIFFTVHKPQIDRFCFVLTIHNCDRYALFRTFFKKIEKKSEKVLHFYFSLLFLPHI
jgi:hypothetical protein